jgi:hypothetical protein
MFLGGKMKSFIVFLCLMTCVCFAEGKPPIRIADVETPHAATLLTVHRYTYTVKEKDLGVQFQLNDDDAEKLNQISRRYLGKHLAFAIGDAPVHEALVRDVIKGGGIWLSFRDSQSLKALVKALAGERE